MKPAVKWIEVTVPAAVLCAIEYDAEGAGKVIAVYEVKPGDVTPRDVEEKLDGEGRLSELDKGVGA